MGKSCLWRHRFQTTSRRQREAELLPPAKQSLPPELILVATGQMLPLHTGLHTHTNKAECTCSKWGFCVCRCLTLIYSTYPSWQNSGTAWRCSLHTVYFLHWAGCELSEHNLQTWNRNARCSWAKYSKVWSILERLECSVCGTCMWRRRRACEVAWPVSPAPPSLSRRLTAPCDWRRSPGRHLPPPNSAKELQVKKKKYHNILIFIALLLATETNKTCVYKHYFKCLHSFTCLIFQWHLLGFGFYILLFNVCSTFNALKDAMRVIKLYKLSRRRKVRDDTWWY